MKLRPNRSAAPGKPDMPTHTRRPPAVIAADKAAKLQEKENQQKVLNDGVKALSKLEDKMMQDDKENEIDANHPPVSAMPKAVRKVNHSKTAAAGGVIFAQTYFS
jgi:hypothetical protein